MNLQPLLSIRSRLKNDAALAGYLTDKYNSSGRYLVGQFKPQNVELDYPFFSFNIQGEIIDASDTRREQILNIYWSIRQSEIVDDVYTGVIHLAEIGELINSCLYNSRNPHKGYRIKHERETYTDFAVNHPFYASGSQYTIQLAI